MQSMAGARQSRAAQGLRRAQGADAGGCHLSTLLRARFSPFSKGGFCICHSVDPERTASQFHCTSKRPYELGGTILCSVARLPHSFVYSLTRSLIHPFPRSLTHHSFPHSLLHRPAISWGLRPGTVLAELAVHRSQGHFLSSGACIQVGDTEHLKGAIR